MHRSIGLSLSSAVVWASFTTLALGQWTATKIATLENFAAPESVAVDPATGYAYVSNMAPLLGEDGTPRYWEDDGGGFISRIQYDPQTEKFDVEPRWIADSPEFPIHKPKGLCLFRNFLLANDNTRVLVLPLQGERPRRFTYDQAGRLNDITVHNNVVYSSDTLHGVIHYRVFRDREDLSSRMKAAPGVNGITWADGKAYCVSWDLHDLYELSTDPANPEEPKPFGLAEHFQSLDAIEVLDDGSFLVTDFHGGKIALVASDRKTVTTLAEMKTPADVGLDRVNNLLFVPSVEGHIVNVYRLARQ